MAGKTPCPKCGEENYPTDRQCLSCGTALQAAAARPVAAPTQSATARVTPGAASPPRQTNILSTEGVPMWLYVPSVLPLGIMIVTRGGAIWGALGACLVGLNLKIARSESLPLAARLGLVLAITAAAYGAVVALVVASRR